MPTLTRTGPIWTIDLGDDENRFHPDWITGVNGLLDDVETSEEAVALVTTGSGRFYSNGLDLEWLGAHATELDTYLRDIEALLARVLTLPVPTVAAVNGHAFGGGALLAVAHDYRVMRSDRGYLCFPEIDIGLPFTPGMSALVMAKVTPRTAIDSMLTGHRFPAEQALAAGLVDGTAELPDLPRRAADLVSHLAGKDRDTVAVVKGQMFAPAARALRHEDEPGR